MPKNRRRKKSRPTGPAGGAAEPPSTCPLPAEEKTRLLCAIHAVSEPHMQNIREKSTLSLEKLILVTKQFVALKNEAQTKPPALQNSTLCFLAKEFWDIAVWTQSHADIDAFKKKGLDEDYFKLTAYRLLLEYPTFSNTSPAEDFFKKTLFWLFHPEMDVETRSKLISEYYVELSIHFYKVVTVDALRAKKIPGDLLEVQQGLKAFQLKGLQHALIALLNQTPDSTPQTQVKISHFIKHIFEQGQIQLLYFLTDNTDKINSHYELTPSIQVYNQLPNLTLEESMRVLLAPFGDLVESAGRLLALCQYIHDTLKDNKEHYDNRVRILQNIISAYYTSHLTILISASNKTNISEKAGELLRHCIRKHLQTARQATDEKPLSIEEKLLTAMPNDDKEALEIIFSEDRPQSQRGGLIAFYYEKIVGPRLQRQLELCRNDTEKIRIRLAAADKLQAAILDILAANGSPGSGWLDMAKQFIHHIDAYGQVGLWFYLLDSSKRLKNTKLVIPYRIMDYDSRADTDVAFASLLSITIYPLDDPMADATRVMLTLKKLYQLKKKGQNIDAVLTYIKKELGSGKYSHCREALPEANEALIEDDGMQAAIRDILRPLFTIKSSITDTDTSTILINKFISRIIVEAYLRNPTGYQKASKTLHTLLLKQPGDIVSHYNVAQAILITIAAALPSHYKKTVYLTYRALFECTLAMLADVDQKSQLLAGLYTYAIPNLLITSIKARNDLNPIEKDHYIALHTRHLQTALIEFLFSHPGLTLILLPIAEKVLEIGHLGLFAYAFHCKHSGINKKDVLTISHCLHQILPNEDHYDYFLTGELKEYPVVLAYILSQLPEERVGLYLKPLLIKMEVILQNSTIQIDQHCLDITTAILSALPLSTINALDNNPTCSPLLKAAIQRCEILKPYADALQTYKLFNGAPDYQSSLQTSFSQLIRYYLKADCHINTDTSLFAEPTDATPDTNVANSAFRQMLNHSVIGTHLLTTEGIFITPPSDTTTSIFQCCTQKNISFRENTNHVTDIFNAINRHPKRDIPIFIEIFTLIYTVVLNSPGPLHKTHLMWFLDFLYDEIVSRPLFFSYLKITSSCQSIKANVRGFGLVGMRRYADKIKTTDDKSDMAEINTARAKAAEKILKKIAAQNGDNPNLLFAQIKKAAKKKKAKSKPSTKTSTPSSSSATTSSDTDTDESTEDPKLAFEQLHVFAQYEKAYILNEHKEMPAWFTENARSHFSAYSDAERDFFITNTLPQQFSFLSNPSNFVEQLTAIRATMLCENNPILSFCLSECKTIEGPTKHALHLIIDWLEDNKSLPLALEYTPSDFNQCLSLLMSLYLKDHPTLYDAIYDAYLVCSVKVHSEQSWFIAIEETLDEKDRRSTAPLTIVTATPASQLLSIPPSAIAPPPPKLAQVRRIIIELRKILHKHHILETAFTHFLTKLIEGFSKFLKNTPLTPDDYALFQPMDKLTLIHDPRQHDVVMLLTDIPFALQVSASDSINYSSPTKSHTALELDAPISEIIAFVESAVFWQPNLNFLSPLQQSAIIFLINLLSEQGYTCYFAGSINFTDAAHPPGDIDLVALPNSEHSDWDKLEANCSTLWTQHFRPAGHVIPIRKEGTIVSSHHPLSTHGLGVDVVFLREAGEAALLKSNRVINVSGMLTAVKTGRVIGSLNQLHACANRQLTLLTPATESKQIAYVLKTQLRYADWTISDDIHALFNRLNNASCLVETEQLELVKAIEWFLKKYLNESPSRFLLYHTQLSRINLFKRYHITPLPAAVFFPYLNSRYFNLIYLFSHMIQLRTDQIDARIPPDQNYLGLLHRDGPFDYYGLFNAVYFYHATGELPRKDDSLLCELIYAVNTISAAMVTLPQLTLFGHAPTAVIPPTATPEHSPGYLTAPAGGAGTGP